MHVVVFSFRNSLSHAAPLIFVFTVRYQFAVLKVDFLHKEDNQGEWSYKHHGLPFLLERRMRSFLFSLDVRTVLRWNLESTRGWRQAGAIHIYQVRVLYYYCPLKITVAEFRSGTRKFRVCQVSSHLLVTLATPRAYTTCADADVVQKLARHRHVCL